MKTLDRQKLNVTNRMRSNIFGWRGQFTPDSKPIEFDGFGNCGEFATIKSHASEPTPVLIPSNSTGLKPDTLCPPDFFNYGEFAAIAKPLEFDRFRISTGGSAAFTPLQCANGMERRIRFGRGGYADGEAG